ncbi:hypothetical protein N7462_007271 [Penicillium macrosclerotiorum]|uniref:uncharacterized protein n=1 Tax=Penicillium macrosclerotiorum TaxID=303699 RepID=UPI00254764E1|nr:uncharacterized protein N7462_007271 [Penicillium macrosclerotiorum]KAJ5679027.1 hypothetical protein N7462_007271 [Penicillium macrosclerotiorum]
MVERRLQRLIDEKPVWKSVKSNVTSKLCANKTSYLLAVRQMEVLEHRSIRSTKAAIIREIERLPSSLEDSYYLAMADEKSEWVKLALSWVVNAMRPLSVAELRVAVAMGDYDTHSVQSFTNSISCDIVGDLMQRAGSLIQIVDDQVLPCHRSLQDNLSGYWNKQSPNAGPHLKILENCLDYLDLTFIPSPDTPKDVEIDESLVEYACLYWPRHLLSIHPSARARAIGKVFYLLGKPVWLHKWAEIYMQLAGPSMISIPRTRLQVLCYFGLNEVISEELTKVMFDPELKSNVQASLELAAWGGISKLLRSYFLWGSIQLMPSGLLQAGNLSSPTGFTPLHQAACRGREKAVQFLFKNGANVDKKTACGESTALHLASRTGQAVVVKMLIDQGADTLIRDGEGYNALMLAARAGFLETVEILLQDENGKVMCQETIGGNTALHLTVEFGHLQTTARLLGYYRHLYLPGLLNDAKESPLHLAAKEGYTEILRKLMAQTKVKQKDLQSNMDNGQEQYSISIELPQFGVDAHADKDDQRILPDSYVPTPLQLAAGGGHLNVIDYLLADNMYTTDIDRSIAFLVAAQKGRLDAAEILRRHGTKDIVSDAAGNTSLHLAVFGAHIDTVKYLVKFQPALLKRHNKEGLTPLHIASEMWNLRLVKLLLEIDSAMGSIRTKNGQTPLALAIEQRHPQVGSSPLVIQTLYNSIEDPVLRQQEGRKSFLKALQISASVAAIQLIADGVEINLDQDLAMIIENDRILEAILANRKDLSWVVADENKRSPLSIPLHLAVIKRRQKAAELLLEKAHLDPDTRCAENKTALHLAADMGYHEMCQILLEFKADVNSQDNEGGTPLFIASYQGHAEVVRELLKWKPNVDIWENEHGWTPLHAAYDNYQITKMLLQAGADKSLMTYGVKSTALAMAAYGHIEVTRLLIDTGSDLNTVDAAGETIVHRAVIGESLEILRLFSSVSNGIDFDVERKDKSTPLHLAAAAGVKEIVIFLLDHGAQVERVCEPYGTVLMAAVLSLKTDVVQLLLDKGANLNTIVNDHGTALCVAARAGAEKVVRLLLNRDAEVNPTEGQFTSALHTAIENNHETVANILLDSLANVDSEPLTGHSTLQLATDAGLFSIVERLLKTGVNVDFTNAGMDSPICIATTRKNTRILDLLLSANADPTSCSAEGESALFIGVALQLHDAVRSLLEKGARDFSALRESIEQGDLEMMQLLLHYMTIIDADNVNREPLLHIAVRKGHNHIAMELLAKDAMVTGWDHFGTPLLSQAITWKNDEMVQFLLGHAETNPNTTDDFRRTPLMLAILHGGDKHVPLLTSEEVDVNATDIEGKSALIHACILDSLKSAMRLLEAGADPTIEDHRGRGALYWSCREASTELFRAILGILKTNFSDCYANQRSNALSAAIAANRLSMLEDLLADDDCPTESDSIDGWNPIYTCLLYRRSILRDRLLDSNFNLEVPIPERPSAWSITDCHSGLEVHPSGLGISVRSGKSFVAGEAHAVVRANYPMYPIESLGNVYYFEVKINSSHPLRYLFVLLILSHLLIQAVRVRSWAIGVCDELASLHQMLGWAEESWGFHLDGDIYSRGRCTEIEVPKEDTCVGCGVNFDKEFVFFTHNGVLIGKCHFVFRD